MSLLVSKWLRYSEDTFTASDRVLRRVAVAAVVSNPYALVDTEDLDLLIEPSLDFGVRFGDELLELIDSRKPIAYGKGALVGRYGEFEHGKGLLTSRFVDPIRKALGNATSWVPSTCKRAGPGSILDLPLGNAFDLRSEIGTQAITLSFPDAPRDGEILVVFGVAAE